MDFCLDECCWYFQLGFLKDSCKAWMRIVWRRMKKTTDYLILFGVKKNVGIMHELETKHKSHLYPLINTNPLVINHPSMLKICCHGRI